MKSVAETLSKPQIKTEIDMPEIHMTSVQLRQLARRHNAIFLSDVGGQVWEVTAEKGLPGNNSSVKLKYLREKSRGRRPKLTEYELLADANFYFWTGMTVGKLSVAINPIPIKRG